MQFAVLVEQDDAGFFVAEVPSLRGCYSQGATQGEALANAREAILLALEDGAPVSRFVAIETVSVDA